VLGRRKTKEWGSLWETLIKKRGKTSWGVLLLGKGGRVAKQKKVALNRVGRTKIQKRKMRHQGVKTEVVEKHGQIPISQHSRGVLDLCHTGFGMLKGHETEHFCWMAEGRLPSIV